MTDIKDIQVFLKEVPGPSPWYLTSYGPKFENHKTEWLDGEKFTRLKRTGKQNKNYTGKTILLINNKVKAILDFQCYVLKTGAAEFLVWYEQTDNENATGGLNIIIFLFDIEHLLPIESPDDIAKLLNQNNKIGFLGKCDAKLIIKTNLTFGTHKLIVPDEFKAFKEILILAKSSAEGQESNFWDKMSLSLFIVNFENETVEVIPQEWFNNGSFDFMYQWPTRIKREIKSNRVYGDGIRIGAFRLTDDNKNIDKWFN